MISRNSFLPCCRENPNQTAKNVNQIDKPDGSLPTWLIKHAPTVKKLRETENELNELLEDHARLTEAIHYWSGKSTERVEEFSHLASELEQEILKIITASPV